MLWSHYAEKHQGVALEFALSEDVVSEVSYTPYRLRLNIEKRLAGAGFSEADAFKLATTKSIHWNYEEEVRIFVELPKCRMDNGLHFEKLNSSIKIVRIILGPLCNLPLQRIKLSLRPGEKIKSCKNSSRIQIL